MKTREDDSPGQVMIVPENEFDDEGNPICCKCGETLIFAGDKIRKLLVKLLRTL